MSESSDITGLVSYVRDTDAESEEPARALLSERSIKRYTYTSLSDPSSEIRLLNILPGVDDPVIVQIEHVRLTDRGSPTKPYLSQKLADGIIRSLPTGWVVQETWSHRILYFNPGSGLSTWQHPDVRDSMSSQENTIRPAPDASTNIPDYEALSYTWGNTESSVDIHIRNSNGEHRRMLVTKNLALALRHLRSATAERTMWIDAICINQEDVEERNTQVKRMTSIFRLAHRVVVWLGPASHSSSLAMSTLEYLAEQLEVSHMGYAYPNPSAVERDWFKEEVDLPYDIGTWDAITTLFERSYFTRVWIMQELHLSNHRTIVQCGSDSSSWVNLRKAVHCLHMKDNLPSILLRGRLGVVEQLARYDARVPFDQLTVAIQHRKCSNDRDRVYGLLGLMPDGLRDRIMPDYEITVCEVYRQATVAQIDFFQRLDVFREYRPHRSIGGPSWITNLSLPQWPIPGLYISSASGISRCYVTFDDPNVAEVSGLQVGMVDFVQENEYWALGEGIEHTKSWPHQGFDRDVFALTLCGMYVRERWLQNPDTEQYSFCLPSLEKWKRYYYGDTNDADDTDQVVGPDFLRFVESCILSKTLFIMGDGQIGLGPETMETGDSVCVFLGSNSPVIIRQQSDGTYQVVGEAFVYALRDAHALLGPLPEPWLIQQTQAALRQKFLFLNQDTGEMTTNDPRLGPLIGWERLDVEMGVDDPRTCQKYKNVENGHVINYDPRMSLDALKERGVKLRTFALS